MKGNESMEFKFEKENNSIVMSPDCVEEYLCEIVELSEDYDGCEDAHDLKKLIDELAYLASSALSCLKENKLFSDSEATDESFKAAMEERDFHNGLL